MNTFDQMTDRGHELVSFHQDAETGLRAIAAVHDSTLGPGFGGCRRWHYATESEAIYDVLRLSEGMTYKNAAANIPIGGGKSVILLPKPDHRPTEAEARAMGRFIERLNGQYISAEDVGVSPQYVDWMAQETKYVMGGEIVSTGGDPSPFTARGVVNAMRGALTQTGRTPSFDGLTIAIQGAGNVGTNIAQMVSAEGAKVLIADIHESRVQHVVETTGATAVSTDDILGAECDILAPCALGGVINANVIRKLRCPIICGGANNILDDYDEDGANLKTSDIVYVPDFIANAGGVIELAGVYLGLTEEQRQQRIADIEQTTIQVLGDAANHASTFAAAVALAKRRIAEHAAAVGTARD